MTITANLLRVSTTEQSEKNISIPAQKTKLTAYCNAKDWDIFDFYIDDGYSGKDMNRPELQRLIKDAQEKKFDVVVVWKLDRLSRRQKDVMYLIEDVFLANGIDFASVTENIDTSTPVGRAMIGVMAVFAQLERETIIERTKMGKEEAARQGRFFGGKPILGYTSQDKKLVIDPLQADIIRKIFKIYLDGNGYGVIAEQLNEQNVPTPRGDSFWYVATVARLLQNPTYAGYIEHLGNLYPGKHEAIISKADWNKVQRMIAQNRYRYGVKEPSELGILRGLVYCGECGARMRVKTTNGTRRRAQYICYSRDKIAKHMIKDENCPSKYIEAHKLEDKVIDQLLTYALHPDKIAKSNQVTPINNKATIDKAKAELQTVAKKIKKWQDAFETEGVELAEFRERVRELRERRQYLETVISEGQQQVKKRVVPRHTVQMLRQFPTLWNRATDEEKQSLLVNIIKKITVYKDGSIDLDTM